MQTVLMPTFVASSNSAQSCAEGLRSTLVSLPMGSCEHCPANCKVHCQHRCQTLRGGDGTRALAWSSLRGGRHKPSANGRVTGHQGKRGCVQSDRYPSVRIPAPATEGAGGSGSDDGLIAARLRLAQAASMQGAPPIRETWLATIPHG